MVIRKYSAVGMACVAAVAAFALQAELGLAQVWTEPAGPAPWSKRAQFGMVTAVIDGQEVVVLHGGNDNNGNRALSDVWHARANGTGWTLVTSRAPARRSAAMAVDRASGRIVTTGGLDEVSHFASDVHASLDFGATWRRTSPSGAPFPGRYAHCMVHVNNEFTLCGGAAGTYHYREDCWTSADGGASWIQTAVSAPWGPRKQMGCAASPTGIMFLAGGRHLLNSTTHATRYEADVWASSDNGRSWSLLTEGGSWMGRSEPSLVYLQTSAKLVLLAGYSERRFNRYYLNDVWISESDGKGWEQATQTSPWTGRTGQRAVATTSDTILVAGGETDIFGPSCLQDTWEGQGFL